MVLVRILVHDKKVQAYKMEQGRDTLERGRLVLGRDMLVAQQAQHMRQRKGLMQ